MFIYIKSLQKSAVVLILPVLENSPKKRVLGVRVNLKQTFSNGFECLRYKESVSEHV